MPIYARRVVDEKKFKASVQRVERALAPDVRRLMFSFEEDWSGEESVFFRVLLADRAVVDLTRLRQVTNRISEKVLRATKAEEMGFPVYFSFRTESEQKELKEPSWNRQ